MITETLHVAGLEKSAEIRIDRWGIPHIRAESERDLFFAQGFNAARDRLWQIDLWRKRGLGLLAADFGPGYLAQDHATRHFLYRGDMAAEWATYAPDAQPICTAFVAGINAYLRLCDAEPARLPAEFALFDTKPMPWQPEDVVRIRTHALSRNALSEILRANVMARAGVATDLLRMSIDPPVDVAPVLDLDLGDVSMRALQLFKLATAPVTFEPARMSATMEDVWQWVDVTELGDIVAATAEEGSNNWVVDGSRTATGRPILASDPHRTHALPSLRYLVHLTAPGFDAIGCGEPCTPGISLGHNGRTAFGLTIHGTDQEDVHIYRTLPDNADRYLYGDTWEAVEQIQERFVVRGQKDQHLDLRFTRHGPILAEDRQRNSLIALRSVWSHSGSCAYLGSLSAMRATSVAAFGQSLTAWGTPSVNYVCADVDGNIGWFVAGFVPVRPNWNGLLPTPGDGSHEWRGFVPAADLPQMVNPKLGYLYSANEMNLPADRLTGELTIGHEWAENSRAERIRSVLDADASHSISAAAALQNDVVSLPAGRIHLVLGSVLSQSHAVTVGQRQAAAYLDGWDHCLTPSSGPAALFEVWWMKHLRPALLARFCPDPGVRALLLPGDLATLLQLLEQPEDGPFPWTAKERDELVLATLGAAFSDCQTRLGTPETWTWGALHHAFFEHAASRMNGGSGWDAGPCPLGGSRSTVMNAGYRMGDFRVISGASVRLLIDVGAWDNALCINAPGQSGDPSCEHYVDLVKPWSEGKYVPLVYSAARVETETVNRIVMIPG